MSMQQSKTSHEELNKLASVVYYLLRMLKSDETFDSNPPLYALLQDEPSKFGSNGCGSSLSTLKTLAKLSTNKQVRLAICSLGGLQGSGNLLKALRNKPLDKEALELMRCACEILTNLTVGDQRNKSILISMEGLIPPLLDHLRAPDERLQQAAASVLRNLSWDADEQARDVLKNAGIVPALMEAAMSTGNISEYTLKCLLLNALWNVSAHSTSNKKEICEYPEGLRFIVSLLSHEHPAIVEIGGGILMNISSHIAVEERLRQILRTSNCFEILLQHLQITNEIIVKNACNTLWNLSARNAKDQQTLQSLGAAGLLGNLVNSENKAIAKASSAALRNLLSLNTSNFNEDVISYSTDQPGPRVQQSQLSGTHQVGKDRPAFPQQMASGGVQHSSDIYSNKNNSNPQISLHGGSSWSSVNHFEESLDESINYSSKYDETSMTIGPACWPNNGAISVFHHNPYNSENFQEHTSRLQYMRYAQGHQSMSARNGERILPFVTSSAVPQNMQMIGRPLLYSDDSMSGPPECPRSYRTEDTPNGYSESMGSLNNIRDTDSSDYRDLLNMNLHRPMHRGDLQINNSWTLDHTCAAYKSDGVSENNANILRGVRASYEPHSRDVSASYEPHSRDVSASYEPHSRDVRASYEPRSALYTENPSSPNDVLVKYYTEGTPQDCFSRASSLSSLSTKGSETDCSSQRRFPRDRSLEQAIALPSINENETLHLPPQSGKILNSAAVSKGFLKQSMTEGAAAHSGTKTVTFDGAFQTPLMYSRGSSIESLSSFDFHSVHSSVISDYSVRASSVVSPSELPDSPGDTIPPSPQKKPEASSCVPVVNSKGSENNKRVNDQHQAGKDIEENDSDPSFTDDEGSHGDEMLSEVIQNGQLNRSSNNKTSRPFYMDRSLHVNSSQLVKNSTLNSTFSDHGQDFPQVYAEEGTPIDFSRAASMNNLSCENYGKTALKCPVSEKMSAECEDIVKHYCMEGTPTTFSRNDSLSSLGLRDGTSSSRMSITSTNLLPKLKSMQSALKSCGLLPTSQNSEKNITSTPASKVPQSFGDEILKYKTEGTPVKVPPNYFGILKTSAGTTVATNQNNCLDNESDSSFSDESNCFDASLTKIIEASKPESGYRKSMTSSRRRANRKSGRKHVELVSSNKAGRQKVLVCTEVDENVKDVQERSSFFDDSYLTSDFNNETNNTIIYRSPGTVLNISKIASSNNNGGDSPLATCPFMNVEESLSGSGLKPKNSVSRKLAEDFAEVESRVSELVISEDNYEKSSVQELSDSIDSFVIVANTTNESRLEDADKVSSHDIQEMAKKSNLVIQTSNQKVQKSQHKCKNIDERPKNNESSSNSYAAQMPQGVKQEIEDLSYRVVDFHEKTDLEKTSNAESSSIVSSESSTKRSVKKRGLFGKKKSKGFSKDEHRKNSTEELKKSSKDMPKNNSKDESKKDSITFSKEEPKKPNLMSYITSVRKSFSSKNNGN